MTVSELLESTELSKIRDEIDSIKTSLSEIDNKLDNEELTEQEYILYEEKARGLTAQLAENETRYRLFNAPHLENVNVWTKNFLQSFSPGTQKITNKQAVCFEKINNHNAFIYNGRKYDCLGANYRTGFSTLIVAELYIND